MQHIKESIQKLNEADWQELFAWMVGAEHQRRESAPAVDAAKAEVIEEVWEANPDLKPDAATQEQAEQEAPAIPAWVDPGTIHTKMYPHGAVVEHHGRIWKSNVAGLNSWQPGAAGVYDFIWEDITDQLGSDEPPVDPSDGVDGTSDGDGEDTPPLTYQSLCPHWCARRVHNRRARDVRRRGVRIPHQRQRMDTGDLPARVEENLTPPVHKTDPATVRGFLIPKKEDTTWSQCLSIKASLSPPASAHGGEQPTGAPTTD